MIKLRKNGLKSSSPEETREKLPYALATYYKGCSGWSDILFFDRIYSVKELLKKQIIFPSQGGTYYRFFEVSQDRGLFGRTVWKYPEESASERKRKLKKKEKIDLSWLAEDLYVWAVKKEE